MCKCIEWGCFRRLWIDPVTGRYSFTEQEASEHPESGAFWVPKACSFPEQCSPDCPYDTQNIWYTNDHFKPVK